MQVSCHFAERSAKIFTAIAKNEKNAISWPEKKKLISTIFFTLGALTAGITFLRLFALKLFQLSWKLC